MKIKQIFALTVLMATSSLIFAQQWTPNGNNLYYNLGRIGIGTSTPNSYLSVGGIVDTGSTLVNFHAREAGPGASVLTLNMRSSFAGLRAGAQDLIRFLHNDEKVAGVNRFGSGTFSGLRINGNSYLDNTVIQGDDNDGETSAFKIISKDNTQALLMDGNEIDALYTDLYLNHNSKKNVVMATGGGFVGLGIKDPAAKFHLKGDFKIQGASNQTYGMGVNTRGDLEFRGDGNVAAMVLTDVNRYLGLGVLEPEAKFHLKGDMKIQGTTNHTFGIGVNEAGDLEFRGDGNKVAMVIGDQYGSVGIGFERPSMPAGYRLAVGGKIICEELRVQLSKEWPDYVFKPQYRLMPLQEVEAKIKEKGHLPGIPSAEDVQTQGLTIGEMQAKMMEKIEELTLYVIELNKEKEELKKQVLKLTQK